MHVKFANSDTYLLEYQHKLDLVKESDGERRIILLGGSNVAFGVSAKMLSDSLGMKVINYGLHAGIGLRIPMFDLDKHLREGDIVVCIPEYENFLGNGFYGEPSTLTTFLTIYPNEISNVNIRQIPIFFKGLKSCHLSTKRLESSNTKHNGFCYSKNSFNEYGDEISHLKDNKTHNPKNCRLNGKINDAALRNFNQIICDWRNRDITLIELRPSISDGYYNTNKDVFTLIENKLKDLNFKFKNDLSQSLYPVDFIFDTNYHLNFIGTNSNTSTVLHLINVSFERQ